MSSKKSTSPTRGCGTKNVKTLNMDFIMGIEAVKESVARKLAAAARSSFTRAEVLDMLEDASIEVIQ